jgi:hypothetical protein
LGEVILKELIGPIIALVLAIIVMYMVNDAGTREPLESFNQSEIILNNGVPCILLQGADKLALSCDWANKKTN